MNDRPRAVGVAALNSDHDKWLRQLSMLKACISKRCDTMMSLGMGHARHSSISLLICARLQRLLMATEVLEHTGIELAL